MMPTTPVGYLLTWTCYGTWLHGDPRGSVDSRHHTPGEPFVAPDPTRLVTAQEALNHKPVILGTAARDVVRQIIAEHVEIRDWTLHGVAVRTNHVHVVVSCDVHPDEASMQFKAWCTRRLREARLFPPHAPIWTERGSDRWLWDARALANAIRYISEYQGDPLDG